MLEGGKYPESGHLTHIKLIAKKGKDPTDPGSYRPISLINVDAKLMSKIMANRLASILPNIISPAQTGFTKGRSATANIRRVMAVLEYTKIHPKEDLAILTLDAEKAFDRISFHWLELALQKIGITGSFLHLIRTLYSAPKACIKTSDFTTNTFPLYRGTRQGCPLSPLLFNIAIEPLARYINYKAPLHGLPLETDELRAILFACTNLLFQPCSRPSCDQANT